MFLMQHPSFHGYRCHENCVRLKTLEEVSEICKVSVRPMNPRNREKTDIIVLRVNSCVVAAKENAVLVASGTLIVVNKSRDLPRAAATNQRSTVK